jgi:hypothetical protein
MKYVDIVAISVLLASSLTAGVSCASKGAGPEGSYPPSIDAGGGGTTCSGSGTNPANLAAAYAALPESRPCWEWLDAQAALLPRKKPSIWKTIYFDPVRFNEVGQLPSDHTVETGAYQDGLLDQYPWISLAPAPPIAPPWAQATPPHNEIKWPFSGTYEQDGDLDEKLRGIATSILHARSKGVATRVSIMLPAGWNSRITITSEQDFRNFVDETVAPQLTAFAKMAERTNSEYMGILSIEAEGLLEAFDALDSLTDDKKVELVQYYLNAAAQAISASFTGTTVSAGVVNYASSNINWGRLDLSGFDEIGLTMSVPCFGDPAPTASIATQLTRVQAILDQNPGKPWSVGELQPPYAVCGDARPASFAAFRAALDEFPKQPVGLGMDIAPIATPADNIDAISLSEMSSWLSAK